MKAGIMEYNVSFIQVPEEFIGKPLQVTTTLTSKWDYFYEHVSQVTPGYEETSLQRHKEWYGDDIETWYNENGQLIIKDYEIRHDAGDILYQETQEYVWDGESNFTGSSPSILTILCLL
jgi:hypothetical protein